MCLPTEPTVSLDAEQIYRLRRESAVCFLFTLRTERSIDTQLLVNRLYYPPNVLMPENVHGVCQCDFDASLQMLCSASHKLLRIVFW